MYRTLLIGLIIGCLVTGGAVSAADRTVTVDDAMEIPERTVTVGGESYRVSSLARVPRGDTLRARTSGVNETGSRVYLHDARGAVVDQRYVAPSGGGTVAFDTSGYEPGSYVLSLYHDGTYADPLPVVVPAYDVSVDTPAADLDGDEADTVSVELTEREPGHAVQRVTVVVSNVTATRRYSTSRVGSEYVVRLDEVQLAPGTYSTYAVVTNGNDAPGPTSEVIGISDRSRFDVERRSPETGEGESRGIDDGLRAVNATSAANTTPASESKPTVISPNLSANETVGATSTEDEAGGTPFALLSLAVILGFLAIRGPDDME